MVAVLDVMIFVTLLALISVTLFANHAEKDTNTDASEVCDLLSGIELSSEIAAENSGNTKIGVWDLAAVSMASGDTDFIRQYLEETAGGILGRQHTFSMTLLFRSFSMEIGSGEGAPTSECTREMAAVGGETVTVKLTVY